MNVIYNITQNKFNATLNQETTEIKVSFKTGYYPLPGGGGGGDLTNYYTKDDTYSKTEVDDKCLFLFEEPESFLHENHQEYFYKRVLCNLANRGHQVIYTTHSARMVDAFDTKSIIRLEFNEEKKQTEVSYNNIENLDVENEVLGMAQYNQYIKTIEPNLNKILFSKKVILIKSV